MTTKRNYVHVLVGEYDVPQILAGGGTWFEVDGVQLIVGKPGELTFKMTPNLDCQGQAWLVTGVSRTIRIKLADGNFRYFTGHVTERTEVAHEGKQLARVRFEDIKVIMAGPVPTEAKP